VSSSRCTSLLYMLKRLTSISLERGERIGVTAAERATAIRFRDPVEAIMTVEQLAEVVREIGGFGFRIASSVYEKPFFQSTTVYVRGARTLHELVQLFADASGLAWRTDGNDVLELYRESSGEIQIQRMQRSGIRLQRYMSETNVAVQ
jgi:hypothetical protein